MLRDEQGRNVCVCPRARMCTCTRGIKWVGQYKKDSNLVALYLFCWWTLKWISQCFLMTTQMEECMSIKDTEGFHTQCYRQVLHDLCGSETRLLYLQSMLQFLKDYRIRKCLWGPLCILPVTFTGTQPPTAPGFITHSLFAPPHGT